MLLATAGHDDGHVLDVATDGPATVSESSFAGRGRPIDAADVEALRLDLAAWQGDLVGWLDAIGGPDRGTAPDR